MQISFTYHGIPTAKGRAKQGKYGHYTPDKTRKAEESFINQVIRFAPPEPIPAGTPIRLDIDLYMPIPQLSEKKEKSLLAFPWHVKKPDRDNLLKLVQDAMNGVFWHDDSQICDGRTRKMYSKNPRVEVVITIIDYFPE